MKRIIIVMLVCIALTLSFVAVAAADGPTTVTMNWLGGGTVGTTVTSGNDAVSTFSTGGSAITGTFSVTDQNDNPYNYQVDSVQSIINASVTDGYINFQMNRNDSYTGMYGSAGQVSLGAIAVSGGTASYADRFTTNYAQMVDASYTYQLAGGHNMTANANNYSMIRAISEGNGDSAGFTATGGGTATLDCMSSEASGVWPLTLGRGAGCYTDANFSAAGFGNLNVGGVGHNSVTFNGMGVTVIGNGSANSATLNFLAGWVGSVSMADYSMTIQ